MLEKIRAKAILSAVCLLALSASPVLAEAPGNDHVGTPVVIGSIPFTDSLNTSDATTAPTDPDCGEGTGPTVWYQYTATADVRLEVNTFGSDYDTTLYIGTTGFIWCGTDKIRFDAEAGSTYMFMVGSLGSGPGGSLVFNLFAPTIVPVAFEVTLKSLGSVDSDGVATLEGTLSCTGADDVGIQVFMTQDRGRHIFVEGNGLVFVPCSAVATWQLQISARNDSFRPGRADVQFRGSACNPDVCVDHYVERAVSLRR
jgi:hypothetical protein